MTKQERNLWIGILLATLIIFAMAAVGIAQEIPECPLQTTAAATIYLVAIYAHEDPANLGRRYVYQTEPMTIHPGEVANPCPCESYPIGFEWYWTIPEFSKANALAKSCGDTDRVYPFIFEDGFETGNTARWTTTIGG